MDRSRPSVLLAQYPRVKIFPLWKAVLRWSENAIEQSWMDRLLRPMQKKTFVPRVVAFFIRLIDCVLRVRLGQYPRVKIFPSLDSCAGTAGERDLSTDGSFLTHERRSMDRSRPAIVPVQYSRVKIFPLWKAVLGWSENAIDPWMDGWIIASTDDIVSSFVSFGFLFCIIDLWIDRVFRTIPSQFPRVKISLLDGCEGGCRSTRSRFDGWNKATFSRSFGILFCLIDLWIDRVFRIILRSFRE